MAKPKTRKGMSEKEEVGEMREEAVEKKSMKDVAGMKKQMQRMSQTMGRRK